MNTQQAPANDNRPRPPARPLFAATRRLLNSLEEPPARMPVEPRRVETS